MRSFLRVKEKRKEKVDTEVRWNQFKPQALDLNRFKVMDSMELWVGQ